MQQLLTHQEHLSFFLVLMMLTFLVFSFVCCPIMCLYVLSSVLCDVNYDFRINFIFGSSLPPVVCMRAYVLIYVICVCGVQYIVLFLVLICLRIVS